MARVSLKDLIVADLLKPGDELTCEPTKGKLYKATVEADGSILYQGKRFGHPSPWATEVAGNNRDGWKNVCRNRIPLKELREELLKKLGTPVPVQEIKGPGSEPKLKPKVVVPEIPAELIAQSIEQQLQAKLLTLDPPSFERVVGRVLQALGVTEVRITGRTSDGGIDGEGTIPVLSMKVAFQAKRYGPENSVGIEPVQRLIGTVAGRKYDRGVFVTTSSFTPGAREEAARPDSKIVLIDGKALVTLMVEKGRGIIRVPVVRVELDEDFFGGLSAPRA